MSTLHLASPEPEKPSASVVYVTPAIAERWLGKNVKNRNLKPGKLAQYTRDMAAGRWQLTGEAIKFDTAGNLLDGQNRLNAVIASGATVPFFVVRGIDPSAQDVMDSGAPRSPGDALGLHGFLGGNRIAAVLNVYTCWDQGLYVHAMAAPDSKQKLTNSEIVALACERPDLVEATRFAMRIQRSLPGVPVGAVALTYHLFADIDADDAEEFFSRIVNLTTAGKGDPVHTLVKRLGEYRDKRETLRASTALYLIIRAWNACRSGETLHAMKIGSEMKGWGRIPVPK